MERFPPESNSGLSRIPAKGRPTYLGFFCFLLAAHFVCSENSKTRNESPTLEQVNPTVSLSTKDGQRHVAVSHLGNLESVAPVQDYDDYFVTAQT